MNAFLAAFLFFAGALGATLFGFLLRKNLPEHHVSEHSRSIIVLSTKLIATMTALLLGLLVSSANDSLQSFSSGLEQMGARLATTDRLLKDYGPETREVRHSLREHAALTVALIWPEEHERLVGLNLLATGQLPQGGGGRCGARCLACSSRLGDQLFPSGNRGKTARPEAPGRG